VGVKSSVDDDRETADTRKVLRREGVAEVKLDESELLRDNNEDGVIGGDGELDEGVGDVMAGELLTGEGGGIGRVGTGEFCSWLLDSASPSLSALTAETVAKQ
jgi:hypothetical protein